MVRKVTDSTMKDIVHIEGNRLYLYWWPDGAYRVVLPGDHMDITGKLKKQQHARIRSRLIRTKQLMEPFPCLYEHEERGRSQFPPAPVVVNDLKRPIAEIGDIHSPNLLLWAPELMDADFNPSGCSPGYYHDGPVEFNGKDYPEGTWVGAVWDGCNDEWVTRAVNPTHFCYIMEPEK